MDNLRNKTGIETEPNGHPALNAAIKGERFKGGNGNVSGFGGHKLVPLCEAAYAATHIDVNRKMPSRRREISELSELAQRLIAFSAKLDLKQDGLAARLGMKQSNVSRWESDEGTPSLKAYGQLMKLARENGLEEYRIFFLEQVRKLLAEAEIPVDELRRAYTPKERVELKRA
jgi:DNA-binding transcriptional regulator YiaG